MAKKGIEVWSDYDRQGVWTLHIKKARGKLTLEEIQDVCMEYEQDFICWSSVQWTKQRNSIMKRMI